MVLRGLGTKQIFQYYSWPTNHASYNQVEADYQHGMKNKNQNIIPPSESEDYSA